ncbi:phosphotransferase [Phycicoccus flavus]|uniref:phosphotransferase n=1 Tax=Phycicoccus flavus TaxID=2502783 RepID=UPI000FEB61CC|nr:phosphotransferase [Phycicoccus flavus]NHA66594.1 phosphotransferase [Phycicoccus flavus]
MLPDDVAAAVRAAGPDPDGLREVRKPGPPRPVRRWTGDTVLLDLATSAEGRRLVAAEVAGRRWAAEAGVPVPAVLAVGAGDGWMLTARAPGVSCRGAGAVRAALAAADAVAACRAPLPTVPASTWRGDQRTLVARVARSAVGGLPLRRFRAARAAAAALTDQAPGHGDLYRRNVLADGDRVSVVDWEFLSTHPRWTDHVRLWSTLTDPADRAVAVAHLEAVVPAAAHGHLAVLVRHLSLRLLAENLAAPPAERNSDDVDHARRVVPEGERLASVLIT